MKSNRKSTIDTKAINVITERYIQCSTDKFVLVDPPARQRDSTKNSHVISFIGSIGCPSMASHGLFYSFNRKHLDDKIGADALKIWKIYWISIRHQTQYSRHHISDIDRRSSIKEIIVICSTGTKKMKKTKNPKRGKNNQRKHSHSMWLALR